MNPNLIPFDQMTPERHRELSSRGGIASGKTRRRKTAMRQGFIELMRQHAIKEDVIDEFGQAVDIVFARENRRKKDAQRKRTKRAQSKAVLREKEKIAEEN